MGGEPDIVHRSPKCLLEEVLIAEPNNWDWQKMILIAYQRMLVLRTIYSEFGVWDVRINDLRWSIRELQQVAIAEDKQKLNCILIDPTELLSASLSADEEPAMVIIRLGNVEWQSDYGSPAYELVALAFSAIYQGAYTKVAMERWYPIHD